MHQAWVMEAWTKPSHVHRAFAEGDHSLIKDDTPRCGLGCALSSGGNPQQRAALYPKYEITRGLGKLVMGWRLLSLRICYKVIKPLLYWEKLSGKSWWGEVDTLDYSFS